AFRAESTLKGDQLRPHGATGPGHFALGIEAEAIDAWRQLLQEHGVLIEKEVAWPRGGRSMYFRDPAGNLVELVTPGIWGLPSGWGWPDAARPSNHPGISPESQSAPRGA